MVLIPIAPYTETYMSEANGSPMTIIIIILMALFQAWPLVIILVIWFILVPAGIRSFVHNGLLLGFIVIFIHGLI
jgi:hypothetical protein